MMMQVMVPNENRRRIGRQRKDCDQAVTAICAAVCRKLGRVAMWLHGQGAASMGNQWAVLLYQWAMLLHQWARR